MGVFSEIQCFVHAVTFPQVRIYCCIKKLQSVRRTEREREREMGGEHSQREEEEEERGGF